MDLSKQFESIVNTIVENVQTRVSDQITNIVKSELKSQLESFDYTTLINDVANEKVTEKIAELEFDAEAVQRQIAAATQVVVNNINKQSDENIGALISQKVNSIDFGEQLSRSLTTVINTKLTSFNFPPASIPPSGIKLDDLVITGDHIKGGIIENFSSTGIDDRATNCVVTILDAAVVVENNLVTMDLTVQGNLDVKGQIPPDSEFFKNLTVSVSSKVKSDLNEDFFTDYSDIIFTKIKRDGLDLSKITVNENVVIEGNRLGMGITESNLQKLGLLKELQVSGETAIAGTFYVGNKRVGVNTLEPSAALAVWDAEIEITASKLRENVGMITTPRSQTLVLGSNRNQNIVLNTDGSAQIDDLRVGSMKITSSEVPPSFTSTKGHVVFNANPNPGGPLGWVCLGAANWANFGIID